MTKPGPGRCIGQCRQSEDDDGCERERFRDRHFVPSVVHKMGLVIQLGKTRNQYHGRSAVSISSRANGRAPPQPLRQWRQRRMGGAYVCGGGYG
jgi:hypothetical protein